MCNEKYYCQNRKAIRRRYGEHMARIKCGRSEKSSVIQNILNSGRFVEKSSLKFVQHIMNRRLLNTKER